MDTPEIGMAQARALNQQDESQVGCCNGIRDPAQERNRGVRAHQTSDDVREELRVRVGDNPARVAERVEESAVEAERITGTQEKTGNYEKGRAARGGPDKECASVAAGGEQREEDDRIELEADRKGEEAGSGGAAAALVQREHTQQGHYDEDAHLPTHEIEQEGVCGAAEGDEEKLNR